MTRTAISPRLATRTLLNMRRGMLSRCDARTPADRPPRRIDLERGGAPAGPARPPAVGLGPRAVRRARACASPLGLPVGADPLLRSHARPRDRRAARRATRPLRP